MFGQSHFLFCIVIYLNLKQGWPRRGPRAILARMCFRNGILVKKSVTYQPKIPQKRRFWPAKSFSVKSLVLQGFLSRFWPSNDKRCPPLF